MTGPEHSSHPADAVPLPPQSVRIAPRVLTTRGDRVARFYFLIGLAAYLVLAGVIAATLVLNSQSPWPEALAGLIGLGGTKPNWPVFFLVATGFVLTALSCRRIGADISSIAKEEDDVDWVAAYGKPGLLLVFEEPSARSKLMAKVRAGDPNIELSGKAQVETLIDERVRRLHLSAEGAEMGLVGAAELRGIAEVRTAEYGGFARHAVSMLLLIAVLGTFAGIKTALPQLTEAIGSSIDPVGNGQDQEAQSKASAAALQSALSDVSAAFGGNSLALVGAVAVGLMAQGIGFGRRNLLERLELVSMEYIYDQSTNSDGNPLQGAVHRLADAVDAMREQSTSMDRVGEDLRDLGTSFTTSFEKLEERLHDIVTQQDSTLYTRTADSLDELRRRITELARLSEANGVVYAGLAEAVKTRSTETTNALNEMRGTNERLTNALGGILNASGLAVESSKALTVSVDELSRGSKSVSDHTERLTEVVGKVNTTVESLAGTLGQTDARFRTFESDSVERIRGLSESTASQIQSATEPLRSVASSMKSIETRLEELTSRTRVPPTTAGRSIAPDRDDRTEALLSDIHTMLKEGHEKSQLIGWATFGAVSVVGVGAAVFAVIRFGWA